MMTLLLCDGAYRPVANKQSTTSVFVPGSAYRRAVTLRRTPQPHVAVHSLLDLAHVTQTLLGHNSDWVLHSQKQRIDTEK